MCADAAHPRHNLVVTTAAKVGHHAGYPRGVRGRVAAFGPAESDRLLDALVRMVQDRRLMRIGDVFSCGNRAERRARTRQSVARQRHLVRVRVRIRVRVGTRARVRARVRVSASPRRPP